MSRVQKLRVFVSQRLNAALDDILTAFEKTIIKYEEEAALSQEVISRQHALLCALHKPIMDLPSADAFTQQLLVRNKGVPPDPQDQVDPEPPHVRENQEGEQLPDLDEADIIQFTYKPRCAVRPSEDVASWAEPGAAGPDQEIQHVSSETEDSDDYSKDNSDTRSASHQPKPKRGRRPGGQLSCRVCSRTFRVRQSLFRHIRAHLQETDPVCGLCGEHFEATETLKLHIQTHQTTHKRGLGTLTRTGSGKRHFHQHLEPDTNTRVHTRKKPDPPGDCGTSPLQAWKSHDGLDGTRKRKKR